MILAGARFLTLDPGQPVVEAVVVRQGRIAFAGALSEARRQAPSDAVEDLGGGCATPGIVDAHGHLLLLGQSLEQLDLRGMRDRDEVARAVAAAPRRQGWVCGRGWDDARWPLPPDVGALEVAGRGDRVALERIDGHALWVNRAAMEAAGIGPETADPPGGRIVRGSDRRPAGVLVDRAMDLVERLYPEETDADRERQLVAALSRCAHVGLTEVHDAGVDQVTFGCLRRLERAQALPIRVYAMQRAADGRAGEILARGPLPAGAGGRLALRAVKLFLDGALGSRGAAFFEPYADGQGGTGLLLETLDPLVEQLARWMAAGFQVALHAIGDRANALALDALERAVAATGRRDLRPRIEHAQHVRPTDISRLAALGAIASMQPTHHPSDWPWARARIGPARWPGAYAWRSMRRAGVRLAFGSDFPIEPPDPALGLLAAVGRTAGPGEPEEALTIREALEAFTAGAAFAAFEDHAGRLAPGFRADLTLWSADPTACAPDALGGLRARAIAVDGRRV